MVKFLFKLYTITFHGGEMLTLDDQRKRYLQLDQELRLHPEDRLGLVDPKNTRNK